MGALHALVALAFSLLGYPLVALFSGVTALAFAAALLAYARHAGDRETVVLQADALQIEQRCGAHVRQLSLQRAGARVRRGDGVDALVELAAGTARVQVGRYLQPGPRERFASELQRALLSGDDLRTPSLGAITPGSASSPACR
jgi:uncharacterized membrane protein